jgi:ABC-type uncharacterized transport system permease subunit
MRFLTWLRGPVPLSILSAFAIGAVFMIIAGSNPIDGYVAMIQGSFGSGMGFANTLQRAIPIIGFGLAVAIAFRAGVINLGTEGQAILGALVGGLVAIYMPGPGLLVLLCALVAGVITGAVWGVITAVLQNYLGVPILISTLLLNYPARYFSSWLIRFKLKDPTTDLIASKPIDPDTQLPMLVPRASSFGKYLGQNAPQDLTAIVTGVNWSLVIVIALIVAFVFMNRRTKYGYESGLAGQNPEFTRYGGVSTHALVTKTMLFSGGLAGLAGVLIIVGAPNTRMLEGHIVGTNYAWTALLVTLLAMYKPIGTAISGLFFAAIIVGSLAMGRELGMSPQISAVIQALVIILIAFKVVLPQFKNRKRAEGDPPPEPQLAVAQTGGASLGDSQANTEGAKDAL